MSEFELDKRLVENCFVLGEIENNVLLLMNNQVAPWFILVPKVANISELYELDADKQASLLTAVNNLSTFIKSHYVVDKLNVAAIGNIVNQLHIHVVARTETDYCWPGVVWGTDYAKQYQDEEVNELIVKLDDKLEGFIR